jgi:hypothetical protein
MDVTEFVCGDLLTVVFFEILELDSLSRLA